MRYYDVNRIFLLNFELYLCLAIFALHSFITFLLNKYPQKTLLITFISMHCAFLCASNSLQEKSLSETYQNQSFSPWQGKTQIKLASKYGFDPSSSVLQALLRLIARLLDFP